MNKAIQQIFDKIPNTYDFINHILTLGFDTLCRRYAAKTGRSHIPKSAIRNPQSYWMDVCTGTGVMLKHLIPYADTDSTIVGTDFSLPMLRYAQIHHKDTKFTQADAGRLPFADNTFDRITISFATRNINTSAHHLGKCLREFHRVIKPGGVFINLETSQPTNPLIRKLVHLYVRMFIRPVGGLVAGNYPAYGYLSQTIPRFYNGAAFSEIIKESGFAKVTTYPLFGGIAAVHRAVK